MKSNTVLSTAAGWCGRLVALLLVLASQVGAQEKTFAPRAPASVDGRRRTLKELRDQYVVKQEFDYSCGAAALATLMRYYFGDHVTEYEILKLLESRLGVEEQDRKIERKETGSRVSQA